jgi:LmbE family N-acetylglucosaminyl deacetylase
VYGTIVAFHAHPDDEVLLTGGTIAWLAAVGHRVIIVVATNGEIWPDQHRGQRLEELRASAAILGADKVVHLGYADSGAGPVLFDDPPGATRFARADAEEAAGRLAGLLADEHADLLLSYDAQGGYGHPDHVQVHQVGARAAQLARVRVVEATVPRELIVRFARLLLLFRLVTGHRLDAMCGYGMPQSAITHQVDVRPYAAQKRAALAAHKHVVSGQGRTARLFRVLVRSPLAMFRIVCGTEWFAEPGGRTGELAARAQTTRGLTDRINAQLQPPLPKNPQVSPRGPAASRNPWPKTGHRESPPMMGPTRWIRPIPGR